MIAAYPMALLRHLYHTGCFFQTIQFQSENAGCPPVCKNLYSWWRGHLSTRKHISQVQVFAAAVQSAAHLQCWADSDWQATAWVAVCDKHWTISSIIGLSPCHQILVSHQVRCLVLSRSSAAARIGVKGTQCLRALQHTQPLILCQAWLVPDKSVLCEACYSKSKICIVCRKGFRFCPKLAPSFCMYEENIKP